MKYNVTVREIMRKKTKKINKNEKIEKAAKIMENNRIGSVIVTEGKKVLGIVTTSDIVYKHVAEKKGRNVSDIMTKNIIKISPGNSLSDAAKLMVERKVEKLPVFENGRLVGIVSSNDILKIEPALFEILLERMKFGARKTRESPFNYAECEICGNYSDSVKEVEGAYTCRECKR